MPKKHLNFRASDLTESQLKALGEKWGTNLTETIATLAERVYQQEIGNKPAQDEE